MNVKQLIELLSQYPDDMQVTIWSETYRDELTPDDIYFVENVDDIDMFICVAPYNTDEDYLDASEYWA